MGLPSLLARSEECLEAGRDNAAAGRWNRAASDLYYAAFNAIRAVLLSRGLEARTHAQVRSEFHRHLVRPAYSAVMMDASTIGCSTCASCATTYPADRCRSRIWSLCSTNEDG